MIGPVSAAIAAEAVVAVALFLGAAITVNGHVLWAFVAGVVQ